MWTRNNHRHNELSREAKLFAARAYYVEWLRELFADMDEHVFSANEFLCDIANGKHDGFLKNYLRTLDCATRVSNGVQALMYLRGYNSEFNSENPYASTRHNRTGGASWTHGMLIMRYSSAHNAAERGY